MGIIKVEQMIGFLSKSISSVNKNKLNGIRAEIDFRTVLSELKFGERVSPGGWILRSTGPGNFANKTIVLFAETLQVNKEYSDITDDVPPPVALHTICSTMHQIGIHSYYCKPSSIVATGSRRHINWSAKQLGIPTDVPYIPISDITGFAKRNDEYDFLKSNSDAKNIPDFAIADEFSKENLRVSFQQLFKCEISDVDGIFWGQQHTYPLEIKEKTAAFDNRMGDYFGLDIGPFVKLAFYSSKKGNLHSLFFVREINNVEERKLVQWWFITFEDIAQYASWVANHGGKSMIGEKSTVVKIPKDKFTKVTVESLSKL